MTNPSTTCPGCGAPASGHFCSSCGTALAGASCAACGAALSPGARFCHRCGTPVGTGPGGVTGASPVPRGVAAGLPWAIAGIALVALIALVVGQRFGTRPGASTGASANASAGATEVLDGANGQGTTVITAPGTTLGATPDGTPSGAMPRAPDISQLTPEQRAERLYDRIMSEAEAGRAQSVRTFLPMAIASYQMLDSLTLDQRYDLGRIAEVGGDTALARAQADTILARQPTHLLGLILAAKAARLERQEQRARSFDQRLLAAESAERATGRGEYLLHKNDLDAAVAAARSPRK